MSTPYGISTSTGSQTFQGYVNAPILGPLNSSQYPYTMKYHNHGILHGQRPTPPQFYPGQEPVYANMLVNARSQYIRAFQQQQHHKNKEERSDKEEEKGDIPPSKHMNYIAPIQSSMYTTMRKSISVGKSSYKVGLPVDAPIGTKSYDTSCRRSALQRARSGGCTAPKKKGSVYNYGLRQPGINGWGSIPRQNY